MAQNYEISHMSRSMLRLWRMDPCLFPLSVFRSLKFVNCKVFSLSFFNLRIIIYSWKEQSEINNASCNLLLWITTIFSLSRFIFQPFLVALDVFLEWLFMKNDDGITSLVMKKDFFTHSKVALKNTMGCFGRSCCSVAAYGCQWWYNKRFYASCICRPFIKKNFSRRWNQ